MAKKRDKGDADASGDFGTEPGSGEPEFGSAEWLLAQLNGGRVPAEAPRGPLLPPQQPAAEPGVEPAAEPAVERAAEPEAPAEAPRSPLLPQHPVAEPAGEWRNPLAPPQQPVQTDAADAAPEPASGVASLSEAWAAAPPPAAPLVPPAAQAFAPPTIDSSLEELFGPPAGEAGADASPFVPPAQPVVPAVAEAEPSETSVVAPSAPTPVTPPVAESVPAAASSDDNEFFAPPRSAQPDFFELAFTAPIAEPVPVDEPVVAEQTVEDPPATAVLPVLAQPAAEIAPEAVASVAPPLPGQPFEQPPVLAAPQQPAPETPAVAAADLSFTSAILTPVDEIEQLFGEQPVQAAADDALPSETTAPAFSWGLTAGGDATAGTAATAALAANAASDGEASLPTPSEPLAEPPVLAAPVFAEELPADAELAEAPIIEFAAEPEAEAEQAIVVEPTHADAEPLAAEPAAAEPFVAEPIVAWADVALTPPAQPEVVDAALDAPLNSAHAEPVGDSAEAVDAFAFAAPAAETEVVPALDEADEEPEATSDDALADWFAASLAAASTDEAPRVASSATEQPTSADFVAMLAHDEDDAGAADAAPGAEAETGAAAFAAPAEPFDAAQLADPFAATFVDGPAGPPPLIAPPAQSEAPLVVPAVAVAAGSLAADSFAEHRPPANTAAAATTPFGGLEPAASGGSPGSPGSGSGAAAGGGSKRPPRALIITLIAVAAVAVLVGLYFVGTQLPTWFGSAPTPVASALPSEEPTAEAPEPVVPTAMQPPGEHSWDALFGGECLDPFTSPWEETFTVVDCAAPHAAQLVYRGSFGGESSTLFPGEEALAGQINALCSVPGIVDLAAASAFGELQLIGSYPVTAEQWESGQQNYYCFLNQVSGEPITGSLAGPGPAV